MVKANHALSNSAQNKETQTEFDQLIRVETILYDTLALFIAELHARM